MTDQRQEFRVVWKREGLAKRTKLYQTRKGAQAFIDLVLLGPPPVELEGEQWLKEIPPIVEGPVLEVRDVGEWAAA